MNVSEAIMERKSTRAYQDKPIPTDVLEKIITAGRWAPNAGEFQISVILNNEVRQKINDETKKYMQASSGFAKERASLVDYEPLYRAPVLILLSGPKERPFNAANTALAAENMLLEATGLGLGSCFLVSPCWILNESSSTTLAKEAGIPESHVVQCAIIIGYPASENKFSGRRTERGTVNYVK